jgi:transposase
MRKIKEILRLKWELGLSARQVGASLNISHSTVGEYLKRVQQAGLDWEQAKAMSEAAIEKMLFPPQDSKTGRPEPNWPEVEKELKQKGVTRMLLWQEYLADAILDRLVHNAHRILFQGESQRKIRAQRTMSST